MLVSNFEFSNKQKNHYFSIHVFTDLTYKILTIFVFLFLKFKDSTPDKSKSIESFTHYVFIRYLTYISNRTEIPI